MKQCKECGSTNTTEKHCNRCGASMTPYNTINAVKALGIAVLFILAIAAAQNDVLMFF